MNDMTPQELLNKAADVIAVLGHNKEKYQDTYGTGSVCAYGAMSLVATGGATANYGGVGMFGENSTRALITQAAQLLATNIIRCRGGRLEYDPFAVVTSFNDADTTDGPTMIQKMKEVASEGNIVEDAALTEAARV